MDRIKIGDKLQPKILSSPKVTFTVLCIGKTHLFVSYMDFGVYIESCIYKSNLCNFIKVK